MGPSIEPGTLETAVPFESYVCCDPDSLSTLLNVSSLVWAVLPRGRGRMPVPSLSHREQDSLGGMMAQSVLDTWTNEHTLPLPTRREEPGSPPPSALTSTLNFLDFGLRLRR